MEKKAAIILAEGFEEIEATSAIDVLRRGGITVSVIGLVQRTVRGSRGIVVQAETTLAEYGGEADCIVLPGGMPGASHLAASAPLQKLLQQMASSGKLIAAICASPAIVLAPLGLLDGKKATCYPGMESSFSASTRHSADPVVVDGQMITSRGPGTALLFALAIVEALVGKDKARQVRAGLLLP